MPEQPRLRFHCPECRKAVTVEAKYAGKRGKCPFCGKAVPIPQTETPKQSGLLRNAAIPLCDVCLEQMHDDEGYVLTTRQVVTTPKYWEIAFRGAEATVSAMPEDQVRRQYEQQIRQQCAQHTGWLTCETCMKRFDAVDRERARQYAADYWSASGDGTYAPPGGESVDPSEALPAANQAWFTVTGHQPPRTDIRFSQDRPAEETAGVAEYVQRIKEFSKRVTDKMQKQKQHQMNVMASQVLQNIAPVSSQAYQSIMAKHEANRPKPLDKQELARSLGSEWQKSRATLPQVLELAHADLRGFHLYGLDLGQANMAGARLEGSDVYGCTFDGANLENARFDGASITSSSFKAARMKGANVSKATTSKCDFSEAAIDDPDFRAKPEAGCFVATACFGSPEAPQVVVLRNFRDDVLMHREWGKWLTCLYYRISPAAAAFLRRHLHLRTLVRVLIVTPVVTLASRALAYKSEQPDRTRLR